MFWGTQASSQGRWPPPTSQQPWHHNDKTPQPQCQRGDNEFMDQSPNTSSIHSPPPHPFWNSLIKMEVLFNAGISFNPRPLPRRMPPPQPSTFFNTKLADNKDDKKREQLSPSRADETDDTSKVSKSLLHQSPPTYPLRDISKKNTI